jgi:hypothetical protein
VGNITFSRKNKFGRRKNKKGKPEEGNSWASG